MKAEFDGKKFSAEIYQNNQNFNSNGYFGSPLNTDIKVGKGSISLILGVISALIALVMLPFGAIVNVFSDVFRKVFGVLIPEYIFVLFLISIILILISITLSVLSICIYTKSAKKSSDTVGLVISIASLVVAAIALAVDLWFIIPLM
jgi:hypothetical protein